MSYTSSDAAWKLKIKSPVNKFVLLALAKIANANNGELCFPSVDTLSRMTGFCRRTVVTALDSLKKAKLISVQQRWDDSRQLTNSYSLHLNPGGVQEMHPGVQEMHPGGCNSCTPRGAGDAHINGYSLNGGEEKAQPPPFLSQIPHLIREQNAAIRKVKAWFREGTISEQEANVRLRALYSKLFEWETLKFGCPQTQPSPLISASAKPKPEAAGMSLEECKQLMVEMKRAIGSHHIENGETHNGLGH